MKIEIKYRKKTGKNHKHVERKQHATKNISRSMEKSRRESKNTSIVKIETQLFKIYTTQTKSSFKREVHSNTGVPQETRKIPNKQHNFTCKCIRK